VVNLEFGENKLDPRIRRTRQMLRTALVSLLDEKPFDEISVQDISERSTVNRATFYDHYTDKSALVEDLVRQQFVELLQTREVHFDGTCPSVVRTLILAVCDFLVQIHGKCQHKQRHFDPFVQGTIQNHVEKILFAGLLKAPLREGVQPALAATAASWAIYGMALQWLQQEDRPDPERFTDSVFHLILPLLGTADTAAIPH
jgi:AcrR family transcriptional regulator